MKTLNKPVSEQYKKNDLITLLDNFFIKNLSERENVLDALEKFLYELIKTVEKLEEIFKFVFISFNKDKKINFNLKNILINELWNHLIQDDLIVLLLKFSKTNENYKSITAKQKEYFELIEKGVKSTNEEYKEVKRIFSINDENANNELIKFEFLSQSEFEKQPIYEDNSVTSYEKDDKKNFTFDEGCLQDNNSESVNMYDNKLIKKAYFLLLSLFKEYFILIAYLHSLFFV